MNLIEIQNLKFYYSLSENFSLDISSFTLQKDKHLFLEGASGSGKTTFLNLLTGLNHVKEGKIDVLGTDIVNLSQVEVDQFRADNFGIIFQSFNLISYLNVIENILLPCSFSSLKKKKVLSISKSLEDEARRLCQALDLEDSLVQKPVKKLSIGQQQRVAIARAVIGQPKIIIADEATSALDSSRKNQFISFLIEEVQKINATLIFVSHDSTLKTHFDEIVNIDNLNTTITKGANELY